MARRIAFQMITLLLMLLFAAGTSPCGENEVLGEIQLTAATDDEKTSGVWIDGQYVGYLKELKGSKKILLLPGEHQIVVRHAGYLDFSQTVTVQPGTKQVIKVAMAKDTRVQLPSTTAEVKLSVNPTRAAVFVDNVLAGHVGEFRGPGRAMLIAPGKHKVTLSLPGYKTFETEIDLVANQKFEIKTDLVKSPIP